MTCASQPDDEWVRAHYARIHRSAWLMTGNATKAEDLAQEVFLVALDRWSRFEGRSSDSTWLYGILIRLHQKQNRTLARLRKRLKSYVDLSAAPERGEPDPSHQMADRQWRQSVWSMVAKLPTEQQQAITLRFAEQMSYQEIAAAMDCRLGTAKTRVHHGLKRLRESSMSLLGDPPATLDRDAPIFADLEPRASALAIESRPSL